MDQEKNENRRRHILNLTTFMVFMLALLWLLNRGLHLNPTSQEAALVGKPAKAFDVSFLQGQSILTKETSQNFSLEDFKGFPLIINFWASWCTSCMEEATMMEQFWRSHKDEKVKVAGIAIQDTHEEALKFARRFGKSYILGLDETGKMSIDYGVTGVPETFFIDSSGVIRERYVGPMDIAALEANLKKIK